MTNLVDYTKRELELLCKNTDEDPMQDFMNVHILGMVKEFSKAGHSGSSASYAISVLTRLLAFKPLTPLTGEDDEWTMVSNSEPEGPLYQNNRYGSVFKDNKGAYDISGRVFENGDGTRFSNSDSRIPVTFPYLPNTEIVRVGKTSRPADHISMNKEQVIGMMFAVLGNVKGLSYERAELIVNTVMNAYLEGGVFRGLVDSIED